MIDIDVTEARELVEKLRQKVTKGDKELDLMTYVSNRYRLKKDDSREIVNAFYLGFHSKSTLNESELSCSKTKYNTIFHAARNLALNVKDNQHEISTPISITSPEIAHKKDVSNPSIPSLVTHVIIASIFAVSFTFGMSFVFKGSLPKTLIGWILSIAVPPVIVYVFTLLGETVIEDFIKAGLCILVSLLLFMLTPLPSEIFFAAIWGSIIGYISNQTLKVRSMSEVTNT